MKDVTHKQLVNAKKRNRKLRKIFGGGFGMFASDRAITEDLKRMALQEVA